MISVVVIRKINCFAICVTNAVSAASQQRQRPVDAELPQPTIVYDTLVAHKSYPDLWGNLG